jgi:hypothetical protein
MLLKFPNSAGTDPIRWFLLKFLHKQLWTSGKNAQRKVNMNSKILVLNIQFKKMLEITDSGRNWSREIIVGKIPVPKWRKKIVNKMKWLTEHITKRIHSTR